MDAAVSLWMLGCLLLLHKKMCCTFPQKQALSKKYLSSRKQGYTSLAIAAVKGYFTPQ